MTAPDADASIVLTNAPLVVVSTMMGAGGMVLLVSLRMKSVPLTELNSTDSGSSTPN